jgi:hypothetical protein
MRHIKTYKIFESRFDDFKEIIDNLHDYVIDFKDDGFIVEIKPNNDIGIKVRSINVPTSDKEPFYLLIKGEDNSYIKSKKYILDILSIIDYMKSEGYNTNIKITDCYSKNKHLSSLEVSSDDLVEKGIRLEDITLIKDIKLTFDKINKNYDI